MAISNHDVHGIVDGYGGVRWSYASRAYECTGFSLPTLDHHMVVGEFVSFCVGLEEAIATPPTGLVDKQTCVTAAVSCVKLWQDAWPRLRVVAGDSAQLFVRAFVERVVAAADRARSRGGPDDGTTTTPVPAYWSFVHDAVLHDSGVRRFLSVEVPSAQRDLLRAHAAWLERVVVRRRSDVPVDADEMRRTAEAHLRRIIRKRRPLSGRISPDRRRGRRSSPPRPVVGDAAGICRLLKHPRGPPTGTGPRTVDRTR
jgi:hypothetical protein